jgi:flagellar basal body-associated protein FliL
MNVSLNKILGGICFLIVLVIIIGTAIALKPQKPQEQATFRPAKPVPTIEEQIQQAQQAQQENTVAQNTEQTETSQSFDSYLNIGELRIGTKMDEDNQTTAVILLEPWLSYNNTDSAFEEEVLSKKAEFKTIIMDFFSRRTASQLKAMGEDLLKSQLLELMNQELVLGSMSGIFFDSYLFFE